MASRIHEPPMDRAVSLRLASGLSSAIQEPTSSNQIGARHSAAYVARVTSRIGVSAGR